MQTLINQTHKLKNNKIKTIKKFHIFYEGQVTESNILALFKHELIKHEVDMKILSIIDLNISDISNNNIVNLKRFLENNNFKYTSDGVVIEIRENDFVFFINDFDIYHDYQDGSSLGNKNRVLRDKKSFQENYIELINTLQNRDVSFYILPSFPSIEFAIMLGCIPSDHLGEISVQNKSEIIKVISDNTGLTIALNEKDYSRVFLHREDFHNLMIDNSSIDRINKSLPISHKEFTNSLITYGLDTYVNDRQIPFTYIDGIIEAINDLLTKI